MPPLFSITPPSDYLLPRDVCSYGYFLLEPNLWDPHSRSFRTTLDLANHPQYSPSPNTPSAITLFISQPPDLAAPKPGAKLRVKPDRAVSPAEKRIIRSQLARMLRLDEDHEHVRVFHRADPRWTSRLDAKPRSASADHSYALSQGRARLFRSPTLFEDVIKTVTSCNVTWPSTIIMNRRLCEVVGSRSASGRFAFPTPLRLARAKPALLRARCSVGYRDQRIVELADMFARALRRDRADKPHDRAKGQLDPAWLESDIPSDQEIFDSLLEWPGVGPYAAANILQLLGRYSRLPLDTESVRHGRSVLGFKGPAKAVMRKVERHFAPFRENRFRAYWFEMWASYEARKGPAWTWERDSTAKAFTAAKLNQN